MQIWNDLTSRILLNWLIDEGTRKRLKSGQGAFEELGICRQYSTIAVIITGGVFLLLLFGILWEPCSLQKEHGPEN